MAIPPIPWQSRIGPGRAARTSSGGAIASMEEVSLAPATIYDALGGAQGLLSTGSALRAAAVPSDLPPVDGLVVIPFPTDASPNVPLVRSISTAGSIMVGLAQPAGLLAGKMSTFHLLVTNSGGSAITLFLADSATGRTPLYYHADHSGARPQVAAGATDLFEVTYLPSPERGVLRKVGAASTFRRQRPTLFGTASPGASENYTFTGQLTGDLFVAWDFRNAVTNQAALRTGFTALQQVGVATEFAMRVSYKVAASDAESIPFPASNAITRCVIQCWRGVDGVNPIIDSEMSAGTGINATIPAVPATEPGMSVVGICGRNSSGALNWLLPANYDAAGASVTVGASLVRCGSRPDLIGSPAGSYTTPGATQAWGSAALLLRGAAL